jgi:choline dehydrogenase
VAGLVIASRLTEDSNKTVLVIEAGATGDAVKSSIDVPGNAYYSSLLNTDYDWQYKTVPQTHLDQRVLDWPRGRVLGGSSAVNGLYL